jgi:hypothetical protein
MKKPMRRHDFCATYDVGLTVMSLLTDLILLCTKFGCLGIELVSFEALKARQVLVSILNRDEENNYAIL